MNNRFEFRSQSFKQKFWLYFVRCVLIWMVGSAAYFLATIRPINQSDMLLHIGGIFIVIWAYANVVQAKTEIQELFVPPFQLHQAQECLVIGASLTTVSWFI